MDLPDLGIELGSPAMQVNSLPTELPGNPLHIIKVIISPIFSFRSFTSDVVKSSNLEYFLQHLTKFLILLIRTFRFSGNIA